MFFEVVEPFFSARLHPNTSLRECVCPYGQSSRSALRTWHRGFFCDRLARQSRLNQLNAPLAWRSPSGTSDWPCRRGPLPSRKGRGNRDPLLCVGFVRFGEATLARVNVRVHAGRGFCRSHDVTRPLASGTEKRGGGPGGGASSPWLPARCRRNFRTDALGQRFILPPLGMPLAWPRRHWDAVSVVEDRRLRRLPDV